jgi:hypothetical protein
MEKKVGERLGLEALLRQELFRLIDCFGTDLVIDELEKAIRLYQLREAVKIMSEKDKMQAICNER